MKTKKRLTVFMTSLAVAWSGMTWIQQLQAEEKTETQDRLQLQLARETLNREVRNRQDEKLGKIQELSVNVDRGVVGYAILDVGGFLGIGGKYVAVPWSALDINVKETDGRKDIRVTLDADKQRLKEAPGSFDKDTWPNMVDLQWGRDVHKYYNVGVYWEMERERGLKGEPISPRPGESPSDAAQRLKNRLEMRKLYKAQADLLGRDIKNAANEDLGDLHDLMIDERTGEIAFAVIRFTDPRYLEDKNKSFAAIPFSLLDFRLEGEKDKEKGYFVITLNSEQVKPRMFDKEHWPSLSDREWATSAYRHFDQQPYWESKRIIIREKTEPQK